MRILIALTLVAVLAACTGMATSGGTPRPDRDRAESGRGSGMGGGY